MSLVLGIDAAWTAKNPSGVALASTKTNPPRLIRAAPSFEDFILGTASDAWGGKHESRASLTGVLSNVARIAGGTVGVIAVDMPVARNQVRARRACDDAISREFGRYKCPTHTPSEQRPGRVSDEFMREAVAADFTLRTSLSRANGRPSMLEVYPHVALLKLFQGDDGQLPERLRYKLSRRNAYWPELSPQSGREKIKGEWDRILDRLKSKIDVDLNIDCAGRTLSHWKAWEDVIDAIVCCWVGVEWLAGRARPYGDQTAAIWVPE